MVSKTSDEAAAWGFASRSEPRWPASLAVLAAMLLYFVLPARLAFPVGPPQYWSATRWILPFIEMALLLPLSLKAPRRHSNEPPWARVAAVAIIAVVSLTNLISLVLLLDLLLSGNNATGAQLLFASMAIWLTNVLVFALWYWELDRGGPDERTNPHHREPDFLFPQMVTPASAPSPWTPRFIDYLYVAATNATCFGPTDTMPLTPWAKTLMLVQSLVSLLTVALVAARAVNILR